MPARVGFREVETRDGRLLVNGQPVLLRGVNRHEWDPVTAQSVRRDSMVRDIELLKRPEGPATGPIAPPAAENSSARSYRWALAPGASTPEHTHHRPSLVVAATPLQLGMKAPDGASMEHRVEAGDFHWVEGRVTHVLSNRGTEAGVMIEVELK